MNNYKYAKVFEKLAIKIVEAQYGRKIDYEKSGITQNTRDYGVDAIISFTDNNREFSTIEAKLRKAEYTLGMKDIASSILFFLVRNGNEHFIVSNVYITSGTLKTIGILNLQSHSKIYYIAGEETFKILNTIIDHLQDPQEKELANLLIENFKDYKIPQKQQQQENKVKYSPENQNCSGLFPSRQKLIDEIKEGIQKNYHLFLLHGEKNAGKTFFMKSLNMVLEKNYKTIIIDVYKYNTIDVFCYELAQSLFDFDLKNLILSISQTHMENLFQVLNDSEKDTLEHIRKIVRSDEIPDTAANYLAEKYLYALFRKCDAVKYLIELEKVSYTSQELYDFIKTFAAGLPGNVYVICEFTYDFSANFQSFPMQYKDIYDSSIKEIEVKGISYEECELYLKDSLEYVHHTYVRQIYNISKGNPVIIQQAVDISKKRILRNEDTIKYELISLERHFYEEIIELIIRDTIICKFFLLLYIFSFSINKTMWEFILSKETDNENSVTILNSQILNSALFEKNSEYYSCKDYRLIHKLEEHFEIQSYKEHALSLRQNLSSFSDGDRKPLEIVKLCFLTGDWSIIDIYESKKNSWMYKSNISWQKQVLKLICLFFMKKPETEEDISKILKAIHYYLSYLEAVSFMDKFENNLHEKILTYKNVLENEYTILPKELLYDIAQILADICIYEYHFFRKTSSFEKGLEILDKCIHTQWFTSVNELKKIKILRYQALLYKSTGDRKTYNCKLENIYNIYSNNTYAQLIYWANKAAPLYVKSPKQAFACLNKCNFDNFIKENPNDIQLYLWVKTDLGIISFYNNDLDTVKTILTEVMEKSERLQYKENIARIHNLSGAVALKENDIKLAAQEFFFAFTACVDVDGEAFFHFIVNYLIVTNNYDNKLSGLVVKYLKANNKRLIKIFKTQELQTCRWFITLYAFYCKIKQWNPAQSKEVEFLFSTVKLENPPPLLKEYFINERLIVLF